MKANVLYKTRRGKITSLGCGVIEFQTTLEASNAINLLTNTELDGRSIKCRKDRNVEEEKILNEVEVVPTKTIKDKEQKTKPSKVAADKSSKVLEPTKVFVSQLPWKISSDDLVVIFGSVGPVVSADVLISNKGRNSGK